MFILLYAEAAEQSRSITLGVPAFKLCKLLLKLRGTDTILITEVLFGIKSILLLHDVPKHSVTTQHSFHNRAVVKLEVVLLQYAHTLSGALCDCAVGGRKLVTQYSHKSGLTGAVGTDDSIAITGCEFQINVLKEDTFAKLDS